MQLAEVVRVVGGLGLCVALPGIVAARFVLRARHPFDLLWQTILSSLLCFTPLVYPAALVAGAPTALAIALPLVVFAIACWLLGRLARSPSSWNAIPPSPSLWVVCGVWFAANVRAGQLLGAWGCDGETDSAYFFGIMRELGLETPARNPELASSFLTHSSGYWFWYACIQRLTGLGTPQTLWLIGPLIAIVLLAVVHRVSRLLWDDATAATASILLLVIPCESAWLRLASRRTLDAEHPLRSFARSLAIAWYNGPPLVLLLLVVGCVVWLVRSPNETRPLIVMMALLVLFPFHHAMYYGTTLCGLAPYFVWGVLKGRLRWTALLAFGTWIPWKLLAWAWPAGMLAGDPRFTLTVSGILPDLIFTLRRHALLLPLVLLGIRHGRVRGAGALVSLLVVVLLPGPWAGGWNRHWQWDPLELVLSLFGGLGVAHLVRRRSSWRAALAALWVLPNVAALCTQGLFHRVLFARSEATVRCIGPSSLMAAATWLRVHTPIDAKIATPPGSLEGQYVEVFGARRLVFGDAIHVDMVDVQTSWRPIEADVGRLFQPAPSGELWSILRRRAVDFVVVRCPDDRECSPRPGAIETLLPVSFRSGGVSILAVPAER